jgi:hypothetical protein
MLLPHALARPLASETVGRLCPSLVATLLALILSGAAAPLASAQGVDAGDRGADRRSGAFQVPVSLYVKGGGSAPAVLDGTLFSRAYRMGPAAGLGARVAVSPALTIRAGAFLARYRLEPAGAILSRYGVGAPDARIVEGSNLNVYGASVSVAYAFAQIGRLRPYAAVGLQVQEDGQGPLRVESSRGGIEAAEFSPFAPLALQVGPGVSAAVSSRWGVFVETLLHVGGSGGEQTVSAHAGLAWTL